VLFRALEGLGEAFYFPASMSLISDYHGRDTRSRAMAAALRGLPLPYHPLAWFALPGLHWISDLGYDAFARNRHRVSQLLGLTACRIPGAAKPPHHRSA